MTSTDSKYGHLLNAEETKDQIEKLYSLSEDQIFLSAYFTEGAYRWLQALSSGAHLKLVIRARPNDFLSGASDLEAVRKAVSSGWDVRFISVLHAKVYLLGDKIVVGSGNLTANGMHLRNSGNLELNSVIDASGESQNLVESIFREAQSFNQDSIMKMEEFLSNAHHEVDECDWWPPDVLSMSPRNLFCNDFPHQPVFSEENQRSDLWPKLSMLLKLDDRSKAVELFEGSQPLRWLRKTVSDAGGSLHFGGVTKVLHDKLADNPAPYRKTVKELLANLLTFLKEMPEVGIVVERPRHSQIVKIVPRE